MDRFDELLRTDVSGLSVKQNRIAHIHLTEDQACVLDTDGILDGTALTDEVQVITEFLNPMPFARNVTIVASGATATGAKALIEGTNMADKPISEELTLNGATPVVGAKAFKTIKAITLPIAEATETVDVGWGDKLGLPFMLNGKPLAFALQDGTFESNAPALTVDDDEVEKNTIDLNSALHSEKAVDIYIIL